MASWSKTRGTQWAGMTAEAVFDGNVKLSDLPTPSLSLSRSAYRSNIVAMQLWCDALGVLLAPHGKTTMAPQLWAEQLDAGAWAITVATESQLMFAVECGFTRIQLANPLIRPEGIKIVGELLSEDPCLELTTWVDSTAAVLLLDANLPAGSRLSVLVDVGETGGRTGVRTQGEFDRVIELARASSRCQLAGTAGYEGAIASEEGGTSREAVATYIRRVAAMHRSVLHLVETETATLSVGGTADVDAVVQALLASGFPDDSTRVVLRPGAYLVHDDGYYANRLVNADSSFPRFTSALHAWSRVLSVPEPGLALIDAGRRDLPYDQDLPVVLEAYRGDELLPSPVMQVRALNDQHGFVDLPRGVSLEVGDVVKLGLSHPCSAFDRWVEIPVVASQSRPDAPIVDLIRTNF